MSSISLSNYHASAAHGLVLASSVCLIMASLIAEQLTMMLKTIHDAADANSAAIANLTQAQQAAERA